MISRIPPSTLVCVQKTGALLYFLRLPYDWNVSKLMLNHIDHAVSKVLSHVNFRNDTKVFCRLSVQAHCSKAWKALDTSPMHTLSKQVNEFGVILVIWKLDLQFKLIWTLHSVPLINQHSRMGRLTCRLNRRTSTEICYWWQAQCNIVSLTTSHSLFSQEHQGGYDEPPWTSEEISKLPHIISSFCHSCWIRSCHW